MSDEERTEEATPRKLRRARERGEVPQSRLASAAAVCAGVIVAVALGAAGALASFRRFVEALFAPASMPPAQALLAAADVAVSALALPLGAAVVAGALASFVQVGPLFTLEPLRPELSRLDVGRGLARVFSLSSLASRAGALGLALLVLALAAWMLHGALPGLLGRTEASAAGVLDASGTVLGAFSLRALALLAAGGAVAVVHHRLRHLREQRMTRRELTMEARETQGEPQARRRRSEQHRERALGPTIDEAFAGAALVVRAGAYAVVLRWAGGDAAPEVALVARGALFARAIELAARAGVPIVDDAGLAMQLERVGPGRPLSRTWLRRLAHHLARVPSARRRSAPERP